MHVFIEPAVFAKYPPAHALTLVPGIWLGLPGLMPALMTGIAGALVFWLARRLANEWTALLTWWLWTTAWATLHVVGVVLLRDHEHGDVADRGCGRRSAGWIRAAALTFSASPPRSHGDSRRGR